MPTPGEQPGIYALLAARARRSSDGSLAATAGLAAGAALLLTAFGVLGVLFGHVIS